MVSIGYMGIEAFDIILYVAKTLGMLNYPVLIIDLSGTGALTKVIYHGMNLDSADGIIHYRNINYIRRMPQENELNDYNNGVVIIAYGLNYIENPLLELDYLNLIVDPFPNHIDKVNKYLNDSIIGDINVRILARDIITLDDLDRVKSSLKLGYKPDSIKYLYYDINDRENGIQCQVSQNIHFRRVSSKMKKLIMSEVCDILHGIKLSEVRKAYSYARRGVN